MKKLISILLVLFLCLAQVVLAGPQNTSSTTSTVLKANVRSYLKAVSENSVQDPMWTNTELLVWINDGTEDIVSRTLCLQGSEEISLSADTIEYTPVSSFVKIISVRYISTSYEYGLKEGNLWSVGDTNDPAASGAQPAYWYEFAGKVGVYPALSSVTTEKVKVYYATQPTVVTTGNNMVIPAIFDKALTYYVVAQALLKDSQITKYQMFVDLYLAELDRYRQDLAKPDKEQTTEPIR